MEAQTFKSRLISYYRKKVEKSEKPYQKVARMIANVSPDVIFFGKPELTQKTIIKEHSVINGLHVMGTGYCEIGKYCHIAEGCCIITANHNYKGNRIPYDENDVVKKVIIEDFVWIGANVTILPGVTIGGGAIVQAGSIIREDVPKYCIVGNETAHIFSKRDAIKFELLKENREFF